MSQQQEDARRLAYVAQQRRQAQARAARERQMSGNPAARRALQTDWDPMLRGPGPLPIPPDQP